MPLAESVSVPFNPGTFFFVAPVSLPHFSRDPKHGKGGGPPSAASRDNSLVRFPIPNGVLTVSSLAFYVFRPPPTGLAMGWFFKESTFALAVSFFFF